MGMVKMEKCHSCLEKIGSLDLDEISAVCAERNLPKDRKEYYRLQKNEYMLEYYQKNRQHILDYHEQYYRNQMKRGSKTS